MNLITKKIIFLTLLIVVSVNNIFATDYDVVSPDRRFKITVHVDGSTRYEVWFGNTQLISSSSIGINLQDGTVVGNGTIKSTDRNSVNNELQVLIGKNKTLTEKYNELIVHYNENYDLIVRAYNEGVAYRFETAFPNDIIITSEDAVYNFTGNPQLYFPEATTFDHWEKAYTFYNSVNDLSSNQFCVSPLLVSYPDSPYKIVLAEANDIDYPGIYFQANGSNSVKGLWAKYPATVDQPDNVYSNHFPITRYDYIANTTGTRAFPWRVIIISDDDKSLLNNELVYLLADPQKLTDVSWVTPGKSAWEWWHKAMLTPDGSADPANGIPANGNSNLGLDLYKYYVDFAAENNIEYMTLDAGWSESYISSLCSYAKSKNVKIMVWTWASNALETPNLFAKWKRFGISGVKIDFFQRNDQIAMNWGTRIAEDLASQKMVGIFHGCPVPTGLNRTYPNILNFEAVLGEEEDFWRRGSSPVYHTLFPFIRSLAGPEDYTPGSMRNKSETQFRPVDLPNIVPSSMGTRSHELSMYVIYDQWLGFLSDAPTEYRKYPDILNFLSTVPTVWDKTVPLDAKLGEYIITAKQTGNDWYVGGMSNWTARDAEVDFSFLKPNTIYDAFILKDDDTSSSYPTKYVNTNIIVTNDMKLTIRMAKGGGFVIRLKEGDPNGVNDIKKNSSLSVHVNKNSHFIDIVSDNIIQSIGLFNIAGQQVFWEKNTNKTTSKRLNISNLTNGAYLVKVNTINGISSAKFIY